MDGIEATRQIRGLRLTTPPPVPCPDPADLESRLRRTPIIAMTAHARAQAHKIKGAAANIGGEAMSRTAATMETDGIDADGQWLETQASLLEQQFQLPARAMDSPRPTRPTSHAPAATQAAR